MFAWGVDLFYTRVTPSGAFDMLNEVSSSALRFLFLFLLCHFVADGGRIVQDFEYYPLLATVIAVVVLTVVTSFLVASKKLREAWQ